MKHFANNVQQKYGDTETTGRDCVSTPLRPALGRHVGWRFGVEFRNMDGEDILGLACTESDLCPYEMLLAYTDPADLVLSIDMTFKWSLKNW